MYLMTMMLIYYYYLLLAWSLGIYFTYKLKCFRIGNIRGASANYRPNEISLKAAAQFRVVEFDKDSKLEILELTSVKDIQAVAN